MKHGVCAVLLVCVTLSSSAQAADDWTQRLPSSKPSARSHHRMAYIGEDRVLLFGGWDGAYDNETWVYDLSADSWTQQSPSSSPGGRFDHAMAYVGGDQVVLFGGWDGGGCDDETWVYDLSANTWTQQSPSTKPSARSEHAMAYIGGDQVLLVGGYLGPGVIGDSWVYDLSANTWAEQSPPSSPPARAGHAMAYIGTDYVVLFGGDTGTFDDETWVYDLSAAVWTQQSPPSKPLGRIYHAMAYIGADQVVLFGGLDLYDLSDETWVYDLSDDTWTQDSNTTQPSARDGHTLSKTSIDGSGYPVLFGGSDDETWTFGGGDYLFTAPPSIDSISDVPNDQGRQVVILWQRSYLDDPAYQEITYYSIWRLYPYGDGIESMYDEWDGSALDGLEWIVYRTLPRGLGEGQADYWELIGTVDAHYFEEYAYIAPTLADSSGSGIPYFTFLVSAHTADPFVFYDSDPDSGYSVDNTTPAGTAVDIQFQGGCAPGTIRLIWDEVTTGVDGTPELIPVDYRVYCSTDPNFVQPPGSLVTTTDTLSFNHTHTLIGDPADNLYYYVTAMDGSDNESDPSNVVGEFDWRAGAAATARSLPQQQDTRASANQ